MASNTQDLFKTIRESLDDLLSNANAIQIRGYDKILTNISRLEYQNGQLLMNTVNISIMGKIKSDLNKLFRSPSYLKNVKKFGNQYSIVETIQNDYFTSIVEDFTATGALNILKTTAVNQMVDNLVGAGVKQEVTQEAANILLRNMQSGTNARTLTEELRNFMLTNDESAGALTKYSGQIAIDSINQYTASYNEQATEDLGFEWYQYVGSLRDTSRPWCIHLVGQRYIHKSELPAAANGNFRGTKVSLAGLMPNTTGDNVLILRGGFNCKHQFRGVATKNVPKSTREKVTGKENN